MLLLWSLPINDHYPGLFQIYYKMSCAKADDDGLNPQEKALLEKARGCLCLSLDRMRGSLHHVSSVSLSNSPRSTFMADRFIVYFCSL